FDRILIESNDPKALFKLFSETLHVPVAWPMEEHETYMSGSVSAGDVTLEFYRYGTERRVPEKARCTSLFLEPYSMEEAVRNLRVSGVPYDSPQFHSSTLPDGSEGTAWTTVTLPSLSTSSLPVTLFEYSPLFLNMEVRRKQFGNRLTLNGGGPLGIISTHSIVVETEDPQKIKEKWKLFLGHADNDGLLIPERGPALRIIRGPRYEIQKLVFKVRSLPQAEDFLRNRNLLEKSRKGEVSIAPSSVQGLNVSLTE
ncbi:MAG: hypothetical protein P8Z37_06615, partial [Acidobacteriota bacterium]